MCGFCLTFVILSFPLPVCLFVCLFPLPDLKNVNCSAFVPVYKPFFVLFFCNQVIKGLFSRDNFAESELFLGPLSDDFLERIMSLWPKPPPQKKLGGETISGNFRKEICYRPEEGARESGDVVVRSGTLRLRNKMPP